MLSRLNRFRQIFKFPRASSAIDSTKGMSLVEVMIGVGLLGFMAAMTMTPMVQFKKTEKMAELQSSIDLDHDIAVQKARNITYLKRKLGIDSKDATTFDKAKADCFSQKGTSCDSKYSKGMHVVETTAPVGNAKSGATKSVSEISFDITCAATACDGVEVKVQTQESTVGATSAVTDKIQVRKRDFNYKIGASSLADRAEIDFSGCSGKFVTGVGFKSLDGKCLPMAGTTDCSGNNDRPMMTFNKSAMGAGDCQATAATTCSSYGYATAGNFSSDPVCVVPAPPTTTLPVTTTTLGGTTTTTVTSTSTTTSTSTSTTTTTVPPGAAPAVACSWSLGASGSSGDNLSIPYGADWICSVSFGQSLTPGEMALCQTATSGAFAGSCSALAAPPALSGGWSQGDIGNWSGSGTAYSRNSEKAAGPKQMYFAMVDLKSGQISNLVTLDFLPPSCGPDLKLSCDVQKVCDDGSGNFIDVDSVAKGDVEISVNGISPNGLGATGSVSQVNSSVKPATPPFQFTNPSMSVPVTCTDQSPAMPIWVAGDASSCKVNQVLPPTDALCGDGCWIGGKVKWPGWGGGWKAGQCQNPTDDSENGDVSCTWETLSKFYKVQNGKYYMDDDVPNGPICLNGQWVPNGVCGSANGKTDLTSAPSQRELCLVAASRPGSVNLSGNTYSWTCAGGTGGVTATCSASKASVAACSTNYQVRNADGNGWTAAIGDPVDLIDKQFMPISTREVRLVPQTSGPVTITEQGGMWGIYCGAQVNECDRIGDFVLNGSCYNFVPSANGRFLESERGHFPRCNPTSCAPQVECLATTGNALTWANGALGPGSCKGDLPAAVLGSKMTSNNSTSGYTGAAEYTCGADGNWYQQAAQAKNNSCEVELVNQTCSDPAKVQLACTGGFTSGPLACPPSYTIRNGVRTNYHNCTGVDGEALPDPAAGEFATYCCSPEASNSTPTCDANFCIQDGLFCAKGGSGPDSIYWLVGKNDQCQSEETRCKCEGGFITIE